MGNFYSRLSYSFGNEDWTTEHKALKIQKADRVLCVTASGDRPLNLLTTELKEIVAVDANPIQNALFDLKKTAIKYLPYQDYLAFLGVTPHTDRLETYWRLEDSLATSSAAIWRQHLQKISHGILYQGAVEKCLKVAAKVLRPIRGKKIDALFSFDDLKKQRQFIDDDWNTPYWKKGFELALHPLMIRLFLKDPGLYEHVDPNLHVGSHLYDRMHKALQTFLAKESVLMSLIFRGKVDQEFFPPYLDQNQIGEIKSRLDRARFETTNLISYLETAPENHFDCFSASDVASYLNTQTFNRMIRGLHRTAKPGARFCIRQFLSKHQIPEDLKSTFQRDTELETTLENEDRCFFYSFMVGTINK